MYSTMCERHGSKSSQRKGMGVEKWCQELPKQMAGEREKGELRAPWDLV